MIEDLISKTQWSNFFATAKQYQRKLKTFNKVHVVAHQTRKRVKNVNDYIGGTHNVPRLIEMEWKNIDVGTI